jgi:hypothetical protein
MWRLARATLRTQAGRYRAVVAAVALAVAFLVATQVVADTLAQVSRDANVTSTRAVDVVVRGNVASPIETTALRPLDEGAVARVRDVAGVAAVDGQARRLRPARARRRARLPRRRGAAPRAQLARGGGAEPVPAAGGGGAAAGRRGRARP